MTDHAPTASNIILRALQVIIYFISNIICNLYHDDTPNLSFMLLAGLQIYIILLDQRLWIHDDSAMFSSAKLASYYHNTL